MRRAPAKSTRAARLTCLQKQKHARPRKHSQHCARLPHGKHAHSRARAQICTRACQMTAAQGHTLRNCERTRHCVLRALKSTRSAHACKMRKSPAKSTHAALLTRCKNKSTPVQDDTLSTAQARHMIGTLTHQHTLSAARVPAK